MSDRRSERHAQPRLCSPHSQLRLPACSNSTPCSRSARSCCPSLPAPRSSHETPPRRPASLRCPRPPGPSCRRRRGTGCSRASACLGLGRASQDLAAWRPEIPAAAASGQPVHRGRTSRTHASPAVPLPPCPCRGAAGPRGRLRGGSPAPPARPASGAACAARLWRCPGSALPGRRPACRRSLCPAALHVTSGIRAEPVPGRRPTPWRGLRAGPCPGAWPASCWSARE